MKSKETGAAFETRKGGELNHIEASQIAAKELEAMIKKISNSDFFILAAENTDFVYFKRSYT